MKFHLEQVYWVRMKLVFLEKNYISSNSHILDIMMLDAHFTKAWY